MWGRLKRWGTHRHVSSFLVQVLVVVVGIGITVAVNRYVERVQQRSDIEIDLELVRNELARNLVVVDSVLASRFRMKEGFAAVRQAYEAGRDMPIDTLRHYLRWCLSVPRESMEHYAMDVLKVSAHYDQLSNDLVLYLSSIYGDCAEQEAQRKEFDRGTRDIYRRMTHDFYATNPPMPRTTANYYKVLMGIDEFRIRAFAHSSDMGFFVEETEELAGELRRSITLIDSLIACQGYETFDDPLL